MEQGKELVIKNPNSFNFNLTNNFSFLTLEGFLGEFCVCLLLKAAKFFPWVHLRPQRRHHPSQSLL